MLILGIETSCDDTSCAVVENGQCILAMNRRSQHAIHAQYGGILPELAAREHCLCIEDLIFDCLHQANLSLNQIDSLAVTAGPGLISSLLAGITAAKTIAAYTGKTLKAVNHLQAHIAALALNSNTVKMPILCLLVSGGHTQLRLIKSWSEQYLLGQSLDDSAGEAFDKVARILNLSYPGGPAIDELSQGIAPQMNLLPSIKVNDYDFSFSGIKTAVMYFRRKHADFPAEIIAATFQDIVCRELRDKLWRASRQFNIENIAIVGGVAANSCLRSMIADFGDTVIMPNSQLCTDNGAMVAAAGYWCPEYTGLDFAAYARSDDAPLRSMT